MLFLAKLRIGEMSQVHPKQKTTTAKTPGRAGERRAGFCLGAISYENSQTRSRAVILQRCFLGQRRGSDILRVGLTCGQHSVLENEERVYKITSNLAWLENRP